jgi:transposase
MDQVRSSDRAFKLRGARPHEHNRRTVEAILWRLDNGAKWRSIRAELGNWRHAYPRFLRWAQHGVWDRIVLGPRPGGLCLASQIDFLM